jgi:hypothetical protein
MDIESLKWIDIVQFRRTVGGCSLCSEAVVRMSLYRGSLIPRRHPGILVLAFRGVGFGRRHSRGRCVIHRTTAGSGAACEAAIRNTPEQRYILDWSALLSNEMYLYQTTAKDKGISQITSPAHMTQIPYMQYINPTKSPFLY